jgi:hypothetical protein
MHRWPHTHVHLIEVDKDRHQREGMQLQMMELQAVVLLQHEEEGGRRESKPNQDIGGEQNNLAGL